MSIHKKPHNNGALTLFVKGAPERVLRLCNRVLAGPEDECWELNVDYRKSYDDTYEYMAGLGHRVLAFAELPLPGDEYPKDFHFDKKSQNYPLRDFIFV